MEDVDLGSGTVDTVAMQWHPTQRTLALGRSDGDFQPHLHAVFFDFASSLSMCEYLPLKCGWVAQGASQCGQKGNDSHRKKILDDLSFACTLCSTRYNSIQRDHFLRSSISKWKSRFVDEAVSLVLCSSWESKMDAGVRGHPR